MKAISCKTPGTLEEIIVPMPRVGDGEALVRIKRVGICGTDLHAYAGNQAFFSYPRILGHELAGEISSIGGASSNFHIGQEVVIIPYLHCGDCRACRQGRTNCCANLKVLGVHIDGGMCEYIRVPLHLLQAADGLSVEEMAIVEPLCIGTHAVRRVSLTEGDWVAVSGCGPIGVGIIWAAQRQGAKVIAIDLDPHRLNFAKEELGVLAAINAVEDPLTAIASITQNEMVSVAFDATGIKGPMERGSDFVGAGGSYVLVGLNKGDLSFNHPKLHAREISLICSRNATKADFELVVSRLQEGSFPSDAYISHKVGASAIPSSFDVWRDPAHRVMKAMTIW